MPGRTQSAPPGVRAGWGCRTRMRPGDGRGGSGGGVLHQAEEKGQAVHTGDGEEEGPVHL